MFRIYSVGSISATLSALHNKRLFGGGMRVNLFPERWQVD